MNDFLINEITKIQDDVKKGLRHSYDSSAWVREDLNRVTGRIESIISLLQNKTIVVKYKGDEDNV